MPCVPPASPAPTWRVQHRAQEAQLALLDEHAANLSGEGGGRGMVTIRAGKQHMQHEVGAGRRLHPAEALVAQPLCPPPPAYQLGDILAVDLHLQPQWQQRRQQQQHREAAKPPNASNGMHADVQVHEMLAVRVDSGHGGRPCRLAGWLALPALPLAPPSRCPSAPPTPSTPTLPSCASTLGRLRVRAAMRITLSSSAESLVDCDSAKEMEMRTSSPSRMLDPRVITSFWTEGET